MTAQGVGAACRTEGPKPRPLERSCDGRLMGVIRKHGTDGMVREMELTLSQANNSVGLGEMVAMKPDR